MAIRKRSEPELHHFPVPDRARPRVPRRQCCSAGAAPPGTGCQGSSRGAGAAQRILLKCCKKGRRNMHNRKCVRNQNLRFLWVRDVLSAKNCAKFYFQGRTVCPRKWGRFVTNLLKMFCPRTALSQGPFCHRDVSLQNFWDEKSIGRFVRDVSSGYRYHINDELSLPG
jgi:hypothetical protein